jgi:hypothetical protein
MLRGQQSITCRFPTSVVSKPEQKGHRNVHLTRRDEVLTVRFYYYYHLKRMRYDDILLELEKEFFITPDVVVQRLRETGELAKKLVREEFNITQLKKDYPLFMWA